MSRPRLHLQASAEAKALYKQTLTDAQTVPGLLDSLGDAAKNVANTLCK